MISRDAILANNDTQCARVSRPMTQAEAPFPFSGVGEVVTLKGESKLLLNA